jgi:hypothetical protein
MALTVESALVGTILIITFNGMFNKIRYTAKNARVVNGPFWATTAYVPVYVSVTVPFMPRV